MCVLVLFYNCLFVCLFVFLQDVSRRFYHSSCSKCSPTRSSFVESFRRLTREGCWRILVDAVGRWPDFKVSRTVSDLKQTSKWFASNRLHWNLDRSRALIQREKVSSEILSPACTTRFWWLLPQNEICLPLDCVWREKCTRSRETRCVLLDTSLASRVLRVPARVRAYCSPFCISPKLQTSCSVDCFHALFLFMQFS